MGGWQDLTEEEGRGDSRRGGAKRERGARPGATRQKGRRAGPHRLGGAGRPLCRLLGLGRWRDAHSQAHHSSGRADLDLAK